MSESDQHSIEQINRRLAEIDAELDGSAHIPSPGQYQLLLERDYLRAQASRYRTNPHSGRATDELKAELEALKRLLKQEMTSRTGYVTSKGGASNSPTPGAWVTLAAQSRAGYDFAHLQARIAEIETEIKARAPTD